jgi:signal transduction histidine kinase
MFAVPTDAVSTARPSRSLGLAVSAALVVVWLALRLWVFETTPFPLTYVLPLLVCVWTRDRIALWTMAAIFAVAHLLKVFVIMPVGSLPDGELWASIVATEANILVGAAAVQVIVNLRERLETALSDVRSQADELRAQREELAEQNEELATQSEELSRQTEELSQQGEELASQNEELQSQSAEIGGLNLALERRERLLEALFDTARLSGSEQAALAHVAAAGADLFEELGALAVVYDGTRDPVDVVAWADAGGAPEGERGTLVPGPGLAPLVVAEQRTAALDDSDLRPDLQLPAAAGRPRLRSALSAPVSVAGVAFGAFAIYGRQPQRWTREQFRLVEWLAAQCGRVLETLRVQSELRDAGQRQSEFLATLSHELRNPLAPIRHALALIEQGRAVDGQALSVVQRQFRHLVRVVDDVLDATRLSSNKVQVRTARLDLVPLVREAVEASRPAIEAAGHSLSLDDPDRPLWVEADADRMAQVVANLLGNAARYTPRGGRVMVAVQGGADEAVVTVSDTGIGLRAADIERVFEMFTQVGGPGSGGLGIGLAIVKGIVERHGGRVQAVSDGPGSGSQFRVTLPLAAAPSPVVNGAPVALARRAGRRVLVVDDNVDAAETMCLLLQLHGHTVWVAHDASSAIETARTAVPDVALLDIGLPDLDGYELARRLRGDTATRGIRLIAVTGWGQDGDRLRARDAGFDSHLTKPAGPDAVLSVL